MNNDNPMMPVCTKCGSEDVYVEEPPKPEKEQSRPTMDEYAKRMNAPMPAIYRVTMLRCKKCGYSVSY